MALKSTTVPVERWYCSYVLEHGLLGFSWSKLDCSALYNILSQNSDKQENNRTNNGNSTMKTIPILL